MGNGHVLLKAHKNAAKAKIRNQWKTVISCHVVGLPNSFYFHFHFHRKSIWRKNSNLTYAELHSDFFLSPRFIQDLFLTRTGDSSSPILSFKKVWKSRLFPAGEKYIIPQFCWCNLWWLVYISNVLGTHDNQHLNCTVIGNNCWKLLKRT